MSFPFGVIVQLRSNNVLVSCEITNETINSSLTRKPNILNVNRGTDSPSDQSITKLISVTSGNWSIKDPRRIELTKSVINFIACSLQPLSRVDDPNFRALLHKAQPAYTLPIRKHLSTRLLPEKTAQLQANIPYISTQLMLLV